MTLLEYYNAQKSMMTALKKGKFNSAEKHLDKTLKPHKNALKHLLKKSIKKMISEEYLNELFDKPLSYERDLDMEDKVRHHFQNNPLYKDHKFGAVKVHKLEGNHGHLIHVIRNGYNELHHVDLEHNSGESGPKMNRPNPKFIGTMMKYANDHIFSKGRPLKISATSHMFNHLKPIIDRLGKKHDHKIDYGSEKIGEYQMHHAIVHPKHEINPIIESVNQLIQETKNATN